MDPKFLRKTNVVIVGLLNYIKRMNLEKEVKVEKIKERGNRACIWKMILIHTIYFTLIKVVFRKKY